MINIFFNAAIVYTIIVSVFFAILVLRKYATKGNDENVVALLLMLGCDKHIQEPGGMTAEQIASGDVLRVIKSYA